MIETVDIHIEVDFETKKATLNYENENMSIDTMCDVAWNFLVQYKGIDYIFNSVFIYKANHINDEVSKDE